MSELSQVSTAAMSRSVHGARVAPLEQIRARFPALERVHEGRPVAYFDGPGGTQVPKSVVDAMRDYLLHHNANTDWAYPTSAETDALIMSSRAALADFLNADPSEIAFGNNMTTLTFHLARSLGAAWGPGDEIVITDLDHHANVAPWRRLEQERGVTIKRVGVDLERGQLDWGSLKSALGPRTKLLAIGAASNALGTISDVTRAGRLAHDVGATVFVDAVHYAPHELVDVRAMDCDFLACSPYKFYGPHTGVLFGKKDRIDALDVPRLDPAHNNSPDRLETGTLNHEGMVGAAAAVDFFASLAHRRVTPQTPRDGVCRIALARAGARRAVVDGTLRAQRRDDVWAHPRSAAHANGFIHDARQGVGGNRASSCDARGVRFKRRFLRSDHCGLARSLGRRAPARRLRVLHIAG